MELENHRKRSDNLKNYLDKYESAARKMYKHELKVSTQTVGGNKPYLANMEMQGYCDANLRICKINSKIERSNENDKWVMTNKFNILRPEVYNNVQEMEQQSQKNKKLMILTETHWGKQNSEKENIKLRIQVYNLFLNRFFILGRTRSQKTMETAN